MQNISPDDLELLKEYVVMANQQVPNSTTLEELKTIINLITETKILDFVPKGNIPKKDLPYHLLYNLIDSPNCLESLFLVSRTLMEVKEIRELAVKLHANNFRYCSDDMKNDREFVKQALIANEKVWEYIPHHFKNDPSFTNEVIMANPKVVEHMSKEDLKREDRQSDKTLSFLHKTENIPSLLGKQEEIVSSNFSQKPKETRQDNTCAIFNKTSKRADYHQFL